jgi:anti-anti-sigma factor
MTQQGTDRVPVIEVIVTEELDDQSLPRLDARLAEALELRPAQLVVDLAACPRMDAAAIGLLVEVHRRIRRAGGQLTLRSPSPRLRRNLELARADRVLHVTTADQFDGPAPQPAADAVGDGLLR